MIAYQGAERELYAEAMRTAAAIARTRAAGRDGDVLAIHQAYQQSAHEMGIDPGSAWAILSSATSVTVFSLVQHIAEIEGTSVQNVTERMVVAAAAKVASGAL